MKKICYVVTISVTIRAFFIPQLKYLQEKGFDVTVVCSPDETLQEELGAEIRYIPIQMPRGISLKGSVEAIEKLYRLLKTEKYDLVQYSTPNAALYASIAGKLAGIKVRNYHLMGFRYLGGSGIGRIILKTLERISCSMSTDIECVSKSNLELGVREHIFPKGKAVVVWNGSSGGVDLKRFDFLKREQWRREIREELGYSQDEFVFGFVGRITRDKGVEDILSAYFQSKLSEKLLLLGDLEGKETISSELWDKAEQSSHVSIHPAVNSVEKYYAAVDVLLLPSYREGFGNVLIEAAAMGTPVVTTRIPGPVDAVKEGQTAYLMETGDLEQLECYMKQFASGEITIDSEKCRKFVEEHFDSEILCEKILERKKELLWKNH